VGEGIFFAGQNHVALRVIASEKENQAITTDPEEVLAQRKQVELDRELRRKRLEQENNPNIGEQKIGAFDKPEKIPWQGEAVDISTDVLEDAEQKAEKNLRQNPVLPQIKNIFDAEATQKTSTITRSDDNPDQTTQKKQHFGYSIDDYQGS
jgi:hypothetical protein